MLCVIIRARGSADRIGPAIRRRVSKSSLDNCMLRGAFLIAAMSPLCPATLLTSCVNAETRLPSNNLALVIDVSALRLLLIA
jgi:hypothetical protein